MRVTVVGGGVIALLTAVECVRAGHDVTVVDQGDIPHSGATSFDRHRIIRALHVGDESATAAAVRAHHRWIELERLLFTRFYNRVGAMTVLTEDGLADAVSTLWNAETRARVLHSGELASRYPHIRFTAGAVGVLEADAGVLLADRVLAACVGWLRWQFRARLWQHRAAVQVDHETAAVRLADGEIVHADALVVAIGPWSRRLVPPECAAELVLHRQSMIYCDVPERLTAAWSATPAIPSLGTKQGAWLVPPVAGTPLKLSAASACRVVDEVGDNSTADCWRDHLVDVFGRLIPELRASWLIDTRDCYYLSRATTGGPMLLAMGDAVFCFAACGGTSFKFAPLIAQSLAQRATGVHPTPTGLGPIDQQHVLTGDQR